MTKKEIIEFAIKIIKTGSCNNRVCYGCALIESCRIRYSLLFDPLKAAKEYLRELL